MTDGDVTGDWSTDDDGDVLAVSVSRTEEFHDLTGEGTTERDVPVVEFRLPADPDLALEASDQLRAFVAEQKMESCGPPDGKPMHQRYSEMEPDP